MTLKYYIYLIMPNLFKESTSAMTGNENEDEVTRKMKRMTQESFISPPFSSLNFCHFQFCP